MTQEEIIRMAREAGFKVYEGAFPFEPTEDKFIGFEDNLERFAALVAAHEREACAKVCETEWSTLGQMEASSVFAAAIRARGDNK